MTWLKGDFKFVQLPKSYFPVSAFVPSCLPCLVFNPWRDIIHGHASTLSDDCSQDGLLLVLGLSISLMLLFCFAPHNFTHCWSRIYAGMYTHSTSHLSPPARLKPLLMEIKLECKVCLPDGFHIFLTFSTLPKPTTGWSPQTHEVQMKDIKPLW